MLLLAADTSGKHGSIALARCGPGMPACARSGGARGRNIFRATGTADRGAPRQAPLHKEDIGGFAVVAGPGSFTGVRVGLAAIKALAEVLQKPVASVSLLEAMAVSGRSQGRVTAVRDAGRGEVYAGEYEVHGDDARLLQERLLTRAEWLEAAMGSTIVVADQNLAEAARTAGLPVDEIEIPSSDMIARLGWQKIQAGKIVSPEALDANYLRSSHEIFSKSSS